MTSDDDVISKIILSRLNELVFKMAYEKRSIEHVTITNPTSSVVTFKMKGTSPDLIHSMPDYGYIQLNGAVTTSVTVSALICFLFSTYIVNRTYFYIL